MPSVEFPVQFQSALAEFAKRRDNIYSLLEVQHDNIIKVLEEAGATQKEINNKHDATIKALEKTKQQLEEKEAALKSVTEGGKQEKEKLLLQISELTHRVKHTQQEQAAANAELEQQRTTLKQTKEDLQAAKAKAEQYHKSLTEAEEKLKKSKIEQIEEKLKETQEKLKETQEKLRVAESRLLPTTPGSPIWISCINWGGKTITNKAVYEKCRKAAVNRTAVTFDNEFFGEDPWHFHKKTGFVAYQYNGKGPIRYLILKEHESARFDAFDK